MEFSFYSMQLFTALGPFSFGFFEQDLRADVRMEHPVLYKDSQAGKGFNSWVSIDASGISRMHSRYIIDQLSDADLLEMDCSCSVSFYSVVLWCMFGNSSRWVCCEYAWRFWIFLKYNCTFFFNTGVPFDNGKVMGLWYVGNMVYTVHCGNPIPINWSIIVSINIIHHAVWQLMFAHLLKRDFKFLLSNNFIWGSC